MRDYGYGSFDVQAWLENGKPFRTITRTGVNPILDSVRKGFHSMVVPFLAAGRLTPQNATSCYLRPYVPVVKVW
jgi:hypothetical protein